MIMSRQYLAEWCGRVGCRAQARAATSRGEAQVPAESRHRDREQAPTRPIRVINQAFGIQERNEYL